MGFSYSESELVSARSNMQSAAQKPEVIDSYLSKEVELGRVVGPLEREHIPESK